MYSSGLFVGVILRRHHIVKNCHSLVYKTEPIMICPLLPCGNPIDCSYRRAMIQIFKVGKVACLPISSAVKGAGASRPPRATNRFLSLSRRWRKYAENVGNSSVRINVVLPQGTDTHKPSQSTRRSKPARSSAITRIGRSRLRCLPDSSPP